MAPADTDNKEWFRPVTQTDTVTGDMRRVSQKTWLLVVLGACPLFLIVSACLGWIPIGFLAGGLILLGLVSYFVGRTMKTMHLQLSESREALSRSIENLETHVQQRTRELEALAAVEMEITSHLSLDEVLKSVTEKAKGLLESEVAFLCLLDSGGQSLSLQSMVGPERAVWHTSSSTASSAAAEFLYGELQECHPGGTNPPSRVDACPGFCRILNPDYRKSHLAAPVRIGDHTIGALCVGGARPGIFRPEAGRMLAQLASIAAVALENSRLYQQAEQVAALEERQRIASDMHDGLLQTLNFLRWMVNMSAEQLARGDMAKALETFHQVERAEEQAESEIRKAIASLQEDFPSPETLQDQLSALVQERSANGPAVEWECSVNSPVIVSLQESEQILRVAREALLNAQKHSQARRIRLCFTKFDSSQPGEEYRLAVIDDGAGFPCGSGEPQPDDGRPHFGLKIMRARASRLQGRITIDSRPGQGTCVQLSWPAAVQRANGQKAGIL